MQRNYFYIVVVLNILTIIGGIIFALSLQPRLIRIEQNTLNNAHTIHALEVKQEKTDQRIQDIYRDFSTFKTE